MAKIGFAAVVVVVVMAMVILMSHEDSEAVWSCGGLIGSLSPCAGYISGGGEEEPAPACCEGVRSAKNEAATTADRRIACTCLKKMAKGFPPSFIRQAATIPSKCGLTIPYKLDPAIDCSKVE